MSVLLNFAMFPLDKGESVSQYVAQVIALVRESGYAYRLNPMGTTFETETIAQALTLLQQAHELMAEHAERIYTTVNIDSRTGPIGRLGQKVESIENHIGPVSQ